MSSACLEVSATATRLRCITVNRLSRKAFIDQTCELLSQRGRTEFALADVLDSCGAQKGSLYHFFPKGKGELVVAAVEQMSDCARSHVQRCLDSEASVAAAVYRHVRELAQWLDSPSGHIAIPFSAIATITGDENEDVKLACQSALEGLESAYFERLCSAGMNVKQARSLAAFTVSAIEGAFLLARTRQSGSPLRNTAEHLRRVIADSTAAR